MFAKWGEMARRSATPHKLRTFTPLPEPRAITPIDNAPAANPRLTILLLLLLAVSATVLGQRMYEVRRDPGADRAPGAVGPAAEAPTASTLESPDEASSILPPTLRDRPIAGPSLLPPSAPAVARAASPELKVRRYIRDDAQCLMFSREPDPDEAGVGAGAPPESPGWRAGALSWGEGRREQQRTGAPLLALIVPDRCELCRELRRDVLDLPTVDEFLRRFIKVRLAPHAAPEDFVVSKTLGVEPRVGGTPVLLLLASPERVPVPIPVVDEGTPGLRTITADQLLVELRGRLRREAGQLVLLAYELQRDDDHVQAERVLDSALRLDSHNAEAWFWRGSVRKALGRTRAAVADLRVSGALDPGHPNPWAELGGLALARRCYEEGVVYASRLLDAATGPEAKGRARGLRARALAGLGWRREAVEEAALACGLGHRLSCDGIKL